MLIKGEKYACEACVRGHRVSNCQHADRPLQHINKKGRPVSQCAHCRTLRKSRSAHVRCDCGGEKTHTKASCPNEGDSQADTCSCSHGTRCTCALKKEHLDPVPESDSDGAASSSSIEKRRPRALTAQSEGAILTSFTNGHHKPAHKHNTMAHKCGLPYVPPKAHSIHGPSPSGLANRSVDNLPHTSAIDALHSESQIKDSIVSAQQEQRMVKSEHGSPIVSPIAGLDPTNSLLPPLDLSSDYGFLQNFDGPSGMEDQPIFSAGLSAPSIDWSHYDGLDFNDSNFATSSYSQAPSFTGLDFSSTDYSALTTTSTSGEISEVEDFGTLSDNGASRPSLLQHIKYGSDFDNSDIGGDMDGYHLSTTSSYIGIPQPQMLNTNAIEPLDLESFMKAPVSNDFTALGTNDGIPITSYANDSKEHLTTPFEDNGDFQLIMTGGEGQALWMNGFTTNNVVNNGAVEAPEDNFWTQ
ncbi:hypothetical protein F5884DRAFT_852630 [Xylogone sp. PMI_703]|nr:hypothetical protein F5884DRAFT_852630 [Xylogone sp. PMI_703]